MEYGKLAEVAQTFLNRAEFKGSELRLIVDVMNWLEAVKNGDLLIHTKDQFKNALITARAAAVREAQEAAGQDPRSTGMQVRQGSPTGPVAEVVDGSQEEPNEN